MVRRRLPLATPRTTRLDHAAFGSDECSFYAVKGQRERMLLRLLAIGVLAAILAIGSAAASDVQPESCAYGAISAIGPVDAAGEGDTTPDVRCLEP
jgi:hypothetical protein